MTATTATTSHAAAHSTSRPDHRRVIVITIASAVAVIAAVAIVAALITTDIPRLNDNAVVLTKFIASKSFEKLPFEQQRQYYKVLDDRDNELDQAYASHKLTESEYRVGLEAAWLGKHINRVEKYFSLPPGEKRTSYIANLLDKKERKKTKPKAPGKNPDGITADETAAEIKVEKWPPSVRSQWESFHDAYHAQRRAREKASKPQTKPASTPSA